MKSQLLKKGWIIWYKKNNYLWRRPKFQSLNTWIEPRWPEHTWMKGISSCTKKIIWLAPIIIFQACVQPTFHLPYPHSLANTPLAYILYPWHKTHQVPNLTITKHNTLPWGRVTASAPPSSCLHPPCPPPLTHWRDSLCPCGTPPSKTPWGPSTSWQSSITLLDKVLRSSHRPQPEGLRASHETQPGPLRPFDGTRPPPQDLCKGLENRRTNTTRWLTSKSHFVHTIVKPN